MCVWVCVSVCVCVWERERKKRVREREERYYLYKWVVLNERFGSERENQQFLPKIIVLKAKWRGFERKLPKTQKVISVVIFWNKSVFTVVTLFTHAFTYSVAVLKSLYWLVNLPMHQKTHVLTMCGNTAWDSISLNYVAFEFRVQNCVCRRTIEANKFKLFWHHKLQEKNHNLGWGSLKMVLLLLLLLLL